MIPAWAGAAPPEHRWEEGVAVERQQMTVLAGWATLNLAGGTAGWALAEAPQARSFHATNAAWNTVNLGIAGVGLLAPKRYDPDAVDRQHRALRTALAINLGLDAVYMGAGAALWARGGELGPLDATGTGQALVLQGAFLAGFDAVFLARHRARTR